VRRSTPATCSAATPLRPSDGGIAGARLANAARIIAIDLDDRKLEWAKGMGATHTIDASSGDVVDAIQVLTDGNGADVGIDTVGRPETWKQAFYGRDLAGTVVLVGVPTPDMQLELPLIDVFGRGESFKTAGTAAACPSVTSRCWSTCTSRVSISTRS
jgi:S-(hydroxymethyl)mycothiol dehydrogenase